MRIIAINMAEEVKDVDMEDVSEDTAEVKATPKVDKDILALEGMTEHYIVF